MSRTRRKPWMRWHNRWKDGWAGREDEAAFQRGAVIDMLVFDHGALRKLWRNMHRIDGGVWRANQPDPARIRQLGALGFRTILNLRGETRWGSYLLEREACSEAGITLIDFKLNSRNLPDRDQILALHDIFNRAERQLLIHCKSGADRAGFVSALYLLMQTDATAEQAVEQLSWRYLHVGGARTGILRFMLEGYAAQNASSPVTFLDWVRHQYDPEALSEGYTSGAAADFLADRLLRRE